MGNLHNIPDQIQETGYKGTADKCLFQHVSCMSASVLSASFTPLRSLHDVMPVLMLNCTTKLLTVNPVLPNPTDSCRTAIVKIASILHVSHALFSVWSMSSWGNDMSVFMVAARNTHPVSYDSSIDSTIVDNCLYSGLTFRILL